VIYNLGMDGATELPLRCEGVSNNFSEDTKFNSSNNYKHNQTSNQNLQGRRKLDNALNCDVIKCIM